MNCPSVAAFVFLTGLTLRAGELSQTATYHVKICMEAGAAVPWVVTRAETIAGRMFADIGVGIEWYQDRRHCSIPPDEFLVIHLSTGASDGQFPGALGYSLLAGGVHIEVFYNRVAKTVSPRSVPYLLAHVFAHELAHMLEGSSRHSDGGLMKAHWAEQDLLQMSTKPLPFGPEDVDLIQRGTMQRGLAKRLSMRRD